MNNTIQRFIYIHQSLQALIGIYDGYRAKGNDSQTLTDILEWMKVQTQNICFRKRMTSDQDGVNAAEVGIICGETYLIKQ